MVNQDKKNKKYLGIDWGKVRIGLAIGYSETKMAMPFKVVKNINDIINIIRDEEINIVVIGEPRKMQNKNLKMDNEFLKFINLLEDKINIPIKKIDERLSSLAADALEGNKKTKASRDALAAMLILQTYLDSSEL